MLITGGVVDLISISDLHTHELTCVPYCPDT